MRVVSASLARRSPMVPWFHDANTTFLLASLMKQRIPFFSKDNRQGKLELLVNESDMTRIPDSTALASLKVLPVESLPSTTRRSKPVWAAQLGVGIIEASVGALITCKDTNVKMTLMCGHSFLCEAGCLSGSNLLVFSNNVLDGTFTREQVSKEMIASGGYARLDGFYDLGCVKVLPGVTLDLPELEIDAVFPEFKSEMNVQLHLPSGVVSATMDALVNDNSTIEGIPAFNVWATHPLPADVVVEDGASGSLVTTTEGQPIGYVVASDHNNNFASVRELKQAQKLWLPARDAAQKALPLAF
eukprot:TRINITY_DN106880_c0_g1_i1.p1 TRINITY_DN106880_c0_g1~~TRINITY_DN106880_c0_g1_i1.p1  ORF type:complete len:315 (+),score=26.70 TRINITY_DN106880_c0_g1_i1:44-946(+)